MYAVVLTGGKQYQVSEGDVISVELLKDAQKGASIELDKVLMVADGDNVKVGAPYIEGGKVFSDGHQVLSAAHQLREGEVISVRGLGKFRF